MRNEEHMENGGNDYASLDHHKCAVDTIDKHGSVAGGITEVWKRADGN